MALENIDNSLLSEMLFSIVSRIQFATDFLLSTLERHPTKQIMRVRIQCDRLEMSPSEYTHNVSLFLVYADIKLGMFIVSKIKLNTIFCS